MIHFFIFSYFLAFSSAQAEELPFMPLAQLVKQASPAIEKNKKDFSNKENSNTQKQRKEKTC